MSELWLMAGALLVGLALGVWWGERLGVRMGYRLGEAAAPLELRRHSLDGARCLLCGSRPAAPGEAAFPGAARAGAVYEPGRTPPQTGEC